MQPDDGGCLLCATPREWRRRAQIINSDSAKTAPLPQGCRSYRQGSRVTAVNLALVAERDWNAGLQSSLSITDEKRPRETAARRLTDIVWLR
jgi:hypothetical protein